MTLILSKSVAWNSTQVSTVLHFLFQNLIQRDTKQQEATCGNIQAITIAGIIGWKSRSSSHLGQLKPMNLQINHFPFISEIALHKNCYFDNVSYLHENFSAFLYFLYSTSLLVKAKPKAEMRRPHPQPLCTCRKNNSKPRRPPQKEDLVMHMHRKSVKRLLILYWFCCAWFFLSRLASSQGSPLT